MTLDLLAGARFWGVDVSAASPVLGLSVGAQVNFTDPILAARTNVRLADRLSLIASADAGDTGFEATLSGPLLGATGRF